MTITTELVITILGFLLLAATFIIARFREAEGKGRMMQKIDTLEKDLSQLGEKVACYEIKVNGHDGELMKVSTEIKGLRDIIESIERKLDQFLTKFYEGRK